MSLATRGEGARCKHRGEMFAKASTRQLEQHRSDPQSEIRNLKSEIRNPKPQRRRGSPRGVRGNIAR
jgi:hypothetical protein